MTLRDALARQRDREANGDNFKRLAGNDRLEFGIGLCLFAWSLGFSVEACEQDRCAAVLIGPLWIGFHSWRPRCECRRCGPA